jgi:hypothetical protein
MQYSSLNKIVITFFILFTNVTFIVQTIIFFNFHIDSTKYNFDKIGLTRLSKNRHFSLCSFYECNTNIYFSLITNLLVIFLLLFQEVIYTSKDMKHTFTKRATSDMIYYPKFISRFVSAFTISMMHMLYQPMNFRHLDIYPKLDLSKYIRIIWFYFLTCIGFILVLSSSYFHLIKNDELGLVMIKRFITGEEIPKLSEYMYDKGIFNYIRAPFRAGIILIVIFINPLWDLGRLELVLLFLFAMYVEAVNDDRYFYTKHDSYKKYMKKVKSRFFNIEYLIGIKKTDEIENNKEKDDIKIEEKNEEKDKKN